MCISRLNEAKKIFHEFISVTQFYFILDFSPGDATTHDIRYLSLYDNSFQRVFHGHTGDVNSLSMNPADDCFASGAGDKSSPTLFNSTPSRLLVCSFDLFIFCYKMRPKKMKENPPQPLPLSLSPNIYLYIYRSVRLWNLSSSRSLATLKLPASASCPLVAFDPTGMLSPT